MATKQRHYSLLSFYEQAGLQDNSYFTECKIILIVAENGHYFNFGVTKRGVAKTAARFARLLPYLTTNPAAAYERMPVHCKNVVVTTTTLTTLGR